MNKILIFFIFATTMLTASSSPNSSEIGTTMSNKEIIKSKNVRDSVTIVFSNIGQDTLYIYSSYIEELAPLKLGSKYLHRFNTSDSTFRYSLRPLPSAMVYNEYYHDVITFSEESVLLYIPTRFFVIPPHGNIAIKIANKDICREDYVYDLNFREPMRWQWISGKGIKKHAKIWKGFRLPQDTFIDCPLKPTDKVTLEFAVYKDIDVFVLKEGVSIDETRWFSDIRKYFLIPITVDINNLQERYEIEIFSRR